MKANRLFLTAIWVLSSVTGVEAKDYIRYVKPTGVYDNDGSSWSTAKGNVQDAINDIQTVIQAGDHGYVFVAAGTYTPTRSTDPSEGSALYMSIQIPAGIQVYGGFAGTETGSDAQTIIDQRTTVTTSVGTYMQNKTIFTGTLSEDEALFEWNESKHRYKTSFFGNCYHVVWFGTNGYTTDGDGTRHYKALVDEAVLDGVVIRDGYAFSSDINTAQHIAFGGGAYMVDGAVMRNCEVYHCESSRGGGGIYMDHGGRVENCYVHDCQTLGVNSTSGFGGGICVDQKGEVTHSAVINNVGRSGGGLSFSYDPALGGNQYGLSASACLVAQNTSSVEAGGIYLNQGGLINGLTIVNNKTFGTGATLNGIVTGRSGGIYVRDHARIYNTVLWQNETTANNTYNLQYAATRSTSVEANKPLLMYVAISRADYTDWSGSKKVGINKLSDSNSGTATGMEKFVLFKSPCETVGHITDQSQYELTTPSSYISTYNWQPTSSSDLCYAGMQLLDMNEVASIDLSSGYITNDLRGVEFSPRCVIGSYTTDSENPVCATIDGIKTLFVDPDRASGIDYVNPGQSWDSPMDNLTDALAYFARNNYSGQILVKEGTLYTASRSAQGRLRNTTVQMASNVEVKGGYPRELTGTDLETAINGATLRRNPVAYPTIISGKVFDKDYQSNVAHLVTFDGVENSVLDGFQLRWGNASSTAIADYGKDGAGVRVLNGAKATLRNVTIADCTAEKGAAIYQDGGQLTCENCILRNNTSSTTTSALSGGVLYAAIGSTTNFNHCDVVRNVGHAVVGYGRFTSTNSFYYSNMSEEVEDTNNNGDLALPVFLGNGNFSGSHNLFDRKSESVAEARKMAKVMDKGQSIWMDWRFDVASQSYPRFVNSTKNAGVSEDGDVTYYGREVDYTPSDMNPAVNAASTGGVAHASSYSDGSWGKDMTTVANRDFGGLPDIGALENGAFSASSATQPAYGTTYYVRDYNTYSYNNDGQITETLSTDLSTTHSDGTPRDGMSWQNAINGNALYDYTYNGVTKGIYGLQYAVNMMHDSQDYTLRTEKKVEKGNTAPNALSYYDLSAGTAEGEVWVAAGAYTKPEGFVMRNHVKVYGGFPKVGNPGMNERHPQLSYGIPLSSANKSLGLKTQDYETILQTNSAPMESLLNKIAPIYEIKREETLLTADMFQTWSGDGADATITGADTPFESHMGSEQDQGVTLYGNSQVNYLNFADLSPYTSMIISGSGSVRLVFNRDGSDGQFREEVVAINGDTKFDLTNLGSANNMDRYVHLNVIKVPWGNTATINSIKLVKEQVEQAVVSNELTDFSMDLDEKVFVVTAMDGNQIFYFNNSGTPQNIKTGSFADLKDSESNYYFMRFTRVGDYTQDQFDGDVYTIQLFNKEGRRYNAFNSFLDVQPESIGNILFTGGDGDDDYGQDEQNLALWRVGYDANGFYLQNAKRATLGQASYISPVSSVPLSERTYVRLFVQSAGVLCQPSECRTTVMPDINVYESRTIYEGVEWNGFTLRNGYKLGVVLRRFSGNRISGGRRNSGAGASLFENAVIDNCIVRQNYLGGESVGRGAGAFCDGGSIKNCYVLDNSSNCFGNYGRTADENFGGGIYMIIGTLYNSVVAHNKILQSNGKCQGAGIFVESASFYNNTIVGNTGGSAVGIWTSSTDFESRLTTYNTIVIAEPGKDLLYTASDESMINFNHCYLQNTQQDFQSVSNGNIGTIDCIYGYNDQSKWDAFGPFVKSYNKANEDYDYRITTVNKGPISAGSNINNNCVNAGTEKIGKDYLGRTAVLPSNDMDWTDRIQDCRVDIGAYEYNGADAISPDTDPSRVESGTVVYYVSELGFGSTQAYDPANAACAEKLQKVLDAAGRYKYEHPDVKVIVKLAGVDATLAGYKESSCFKYYPCRTTDPHNDNVREWSIMVPRGVEVWGGYSVDEVLDKTENDDIAPCFSEAERSVMYHPTFLQTQYENSSLNESIKGYHVVTFTDKTFDEDGNERVGMTLSSQNVTDRAVLDGLFLVGGQADGTGFATAASVNINQYGGAAVVTDYAHVRNCIVKNNTATYGGALALMSKGLVSGTLIIDNTADYGGGIYVIEDEVSLSDGTINNTAQGSAATLDANMPHVYTSTIVKNTGVQQGGGLWFSNDADLPNVRVNSSVLWQNSSPDQANVAGQTSPTMTDDTHISTLEWYPFAYSAVQNQRLSGVSNISVDIQNRKGNRFGIDSMTDPTRYNGKTIATDTTQVDYYGLTVYSALCRTGMPNETYQTLVENLGLAARDYNKWLRDTIPAEGSDKQRTYIDIGARAYPSSPILDLKHPFLRLFVAETKDVNMDAFEIMDDYAMSETTVEGEENYVYSLLGSSFAYPFQNLDDALLYITSLRKSDMWQDKLNNVPFEICMARGDYFPMRDMQGNYGYSLANTFLLPEGVTLMGGFDCNVMYGQRWKPKVDDTPFGNDMQANIISFGPDEINLVGVPEDNASKVSIIQQELDEMAEDRVLEDLNMNNILEPWEFRDQTNLSGNAVNLQNSGVYHVVSVIPYAPGVGQLPTATFDSGTDYKGDGKQSKLVGQPVIIDGVHISDGYARDYVNGSLTDNGIYDYYRGAGLRANGNWYCDNINAVVNGNEDHLYHGTVENAVAYRDIPLYIRNAQFINNQAGFGAAMDVNVSTYIYNCLFAQNLAMSKEETIDWNQYSADGTPYERTTRVTYPGNGGAIHFAKHLEVTNTIFSNNEAEDTKAIDNHLLRLTDFTLLAPSSNGESILHTFGGVGGALCGGYYSHLKMLNCDVVNNKACIYPAIFTKNPNHGLNPDITSGVDEDDYNLVANNVFWGNEIHPSSEITIEDNSFAPRLSINYAIASNSSYNISLEYAPKSQSQLDNDYTEAIWFSGYEEGRGKTVTNTRDYREMPYLRSAYIGNSLKNYWLSNYAAPGDTYKEQNANILLSSVNASLEGPNFRNPSSVVGYSGYNEAADWSRARINNLTDNGSGFLRQDVVNNGVAGHATAWRTNADSKLSGEGIYYQTYYMTTENQRSMDLGDDIYMLYDNDAKTNMTRVASDPNPARDKAYIDLGVYEYPYCRLVPTEEGNEVDVLWVSTVEKPENGMPDGSAWETPTSDLQRAIETLLASRNNHRKEVRVMDGEYSPTYQQGDYKAFYINTKDIDNAVIFPESVYNNGQLNETAASKLGVSSLSIKGGYSKDLIGQYNTDLYPAVIRSSERMEGSTEPTWDYLFYIEDAVQRYGEGNPVKDGKVTTIPMQLDGIRLVNNQAMPGTHGTAIRYDDQVVEYNGTTYEAEAPASATVSITEAEYEAFKQAGETVQRTYWTDETYSTVSSTPTDFVLYTRVVQNPPKLIITKCAVMNSGNYDADKNSDVNSSAVYIGRYGGDALIYNTVFHSNKGNALEAYNTRTINNTVALNRGRWILKNIGYIDNLYETGTGSGTGEMLAPGYRSAGYQPRKSNIMNTILWRNNPSGDDVYGPQFALDGYVSDSDDTSDNIFSHNAYTCYVNGKIDITEGADYTLTVFSDNKYNTHLSLDNNSISTGPNFKNPDLNARTDDEIESRDFSLMPSVRIINRGEDAIYAREVYDMAMIPTTELDFINQPRVIKPQIEVGAIEYPQALLRVIYVDPNQSVGGSGINWEEAMKADQLQAAIDLASVYSATKAATEDDMNEAYVFVKGNNDVTFPGVTMRSGVSVFGSIDPNSTDYVHYTQESEDAEYEYPDLHKDVNKIVVERPGLLGPSTERTTIPYITTGAETNAFSGEKPTLMDGFVVSATSPSNPFGEVTSPVIMYINPTSDSEGSSPAVALSHLLVADNDASQASGNGVDIASIDNALIYEVLFRNNQTKSDRNYVLNLGANAYGVNLTVEGLTNDAAGNVIYSTADNVNGGHIWYSIYNYEANATYHLSDQPADKNTLSMYNYLVSDWNLNYQLTEHSKNIDRCPVVNPMTLMGDATKNLIQFINYPTDVDLLGNPRVLDVRTGNATNKLDRGAFETWCIGDDNKGMTIKSNTDSKIYNGNYYPHEGSVVYLLENSNLISEAHSLLPCYLLVKKGASLFGHGQIVQADYLAVERDVKSAGSIIALPYSMNYNWSADTYSGPATYSYDGDGVLNMVSDPDTKVYSYNGTKRASARYQIQNVNSGCWDLISKNEPATEANHGVLFTCSSDGVYRFTGRGVQASNHGGRALTGKEYIYEEVFQHGNQDQLMDTHKDIVLTPCNFEPNDGNGNLTAAEDMGWNCFGIPYLVSEYKPYLKAKDAKYNVTADAAEYMMHLPKQLWLYYDGAVNPNNMSQNNWTAEGNTKNYAGFYAVESWKTSATDWHLQSGTPALWVSEGMFAQTASYEDESLCFYLPIYNGSSNAAPIRSMQRIYVGDGIEDELDQPELEDTIYDLQGRKVQNPTTHGIYIVNGKRVWM